MARYIILGAGGFIGSALSLSLVNAGHEVIAIGSRLDSLPNTITKHEQRITNFNILSDYDSEPCVIYYLLNNTSLLRTV